MEYLERVLGIHVDYDSRELSDLPNDLNSRYYFKPVFLSGKKAVFVYTKGEPEAVNAVKKHMNRIENIDESSAVLVLDSVTSRYKEYLIREHIPFIVEGKQIYLPFMAVYLQERCDSDKTADSRLIPSAQLMLLNYIYNGCGEQTSASAAERLGLTATSVSRASRQLVKLGILKSKTIGVQKILYTDKTPAELFEFSKKYLLNPVKKTIYVSKSEINEKLVYGSYSALAEYSMLNPSQPEYFAAKSISKYEKTASGKLYDQTEQCAVELWRYDPEILSDGNCADRLSVALSLRDSVDERIEEAVEEMLLQVWRSIDGKRN